MRIGTNLLFGLAVLFASGAALGAVKHVGDWPTDDKDKKVTLDASGLSRAEAVRRLAAAAGWSVVVHAPAGDPIDIHVKNQPAGKVLDLLLDDASYVARRDGDLVNVTRGDAVPGASEPAAADGAAGAATATAAAPGASVTPPAPQASAPPSPPSPPSPQGPPAPPSPPAAANASAGAPPLPPAPPPIASLAPRHRARGDDRVVTGGSLRVEAGETVDDVTVMGGSVDVYGDVTGDLVVMGGSARVHSGGHVEGDATAVGGALDVEDGATVDGDVGVVGGVLRRAPGAVIGGKVVDQKSKDKGKSGEAIEIGDVHHDGDVHAGNWLARKTRDVGSALTRMAVLFVFGAILLSLAGRRMDLMKAEAAARPMRSFALGLVGAIGGLLLAVVLCVTIIGIPVAAILLVLAVLGGYAGVCSVLTTVGKALVAHKTDNQHVHLAVGCALFLVASAVPFVSGVVTFVIAFAGFGVFVATRGAGLLPNKPIRGVGPATASLF